MVFIILWALVFGFLFSIFDCLAQQERPQGFFFFLQAICLLDILSNKVDNVLVRQRGTKLKVLSSPDHYCWFNSETVCSFNISMWIVQISLNEVLEEKLHYFFCGDLDNQWQIQFNLRAVMESLPKGLLSDSEKYMKL